MPAPTYITKDRHGGHLFRIKIPAALHDKSVLVQSLQTYHRPTAIKLARKLAAQTQEAFDRLKKTEQNPHKNLALAKAKQSASPRILDDLMSGRVATKDKA